MTEVTQDSILPLLLSLTCTERDILIALARNEDKTSELNWSPMWISHPESLNQQAQEQAKAELDNLRQAIAQLRNDDRGSGRKLNWRPSLIYLWPEETGLENVIECVLEKTAVLGPEYVKSLGLVHVYPTSTGDKTWRCPLGYRKPMTPGNELIFAPQPEARDPNFWFTNSTDFLLEKLERLGVWEKVAGDGETKWVRVLV